MLRLLNQLLCYHYLNFTLFLFFLRRIDFTSNFGIRYKRACTVSLFNLSTLFGRRSLIIWEIYFAQLLLLRILYDIQYIYIFLLNFNFWVQIIKYGRINRIHFLRMQRVLELGYFDLFWGLHIRIIIITKLVLLLIGTKAAITISENGLFGLSELQVWIIDLGHRLHNIRLIWRIISEVAVLDPEIAQHYLHRHLELRQAIHASEHLVLKEKGVLMRAKSNGSWVLREVPMNPAAMFPALQIPLPRPRQLKQLVPVPINISTHMQDAYDCLECFSCQNQGNCYQKWIFYVLPVINLLVVLIIFYFGNWFYHLNSNN